MFWYLWTFKETFLDSIYLFLPTYNINIFMSVFLATYKSFAGYCYLKLPWNSVKMSNLMLEIPKLEIDFVFSCL